jgi:hypothetical protein
MESDSAYPDGYSAEDAAASLDLVDRARSDLADRLVTPWWYHPALGLIEAAFVVSFAMPTLWRLVLVVVAIAALGGLTRAYSRLTGLAVFGGSYWTMARGWIIALLSVIVVALGLSLLGGSVLVSLAAAALAFVATVVCGRRADMAIRARLRARGPARR